VFPKWAWSGSRGQFVHCGLRKFRHSKSSVYRWYPQFVRGPFVYDTYETMEATRSRHGWVRMFITHCLQLNLQLHHIDLARTCRTSSLCTVAWQLAKFQRTRRIARSLGDSWASCFMNSPAGLTRQRIFTLCGSNNAYSRKDVPFGVSLILVLILEVKYPRNPNFWAWKGVFKPNAQNILSFVLSKLLHRF